MPSYFNCYRHTCLAVKPEEKKPVESRLIGGYGRPKQAMELAENIRPQEPTRDFSKLTDEEWKSLLHARKTMRKLLAKASGGGPSVRTVAGSGRSCEPGV